MKLSDEMIEEAARKFAAVDTKIPEIFDNLTPDNRRALCVAMRAAVTAIYPALRKQVLLEAAEEAERYSDEIADKDQHGRALTAQETASRIRSLMDKE